MTFHRNALQVSRRDHVTTPITKKWARGWTTFWKKAAPKIGAEQTNGPRAGRLQHQRVADNAFHLRISADRVV